MKIQFSRFNFFSLVFYCLILFSSQILLAAEELLYVQASTAKIKSSPLMGATDVTSVQRGQELKLLNTEGAWYQVKLNDEIGWISKLFVSKTKPTGQAELMNSQGLSEAKTSRKRTSSYAVSAATRGLQANERVRDGRELYRSDKKALEDLEKMEISEEQIKEFQKSGKKINDKASDVKK